MILRIDNVESSGRNTMKFLKFIKNYKKLKRAIRELRCRKNVIDNSIIKVTESLNGYGRTLTFHREKKIEFYRGKSEGYNNAIIIIEKFIDTGELPDIQDTED
jgi:hypothetical protein